IKQLCLLGAGLIPGLILAGDGYLFTRYLRVQVIEQVVGQQESLCKDLPSSKSQQVEELLSQWRGQQLRVLKSDLESRLGENAKAEFSDFVQRFERARQEGNQELLNGIAAELQMEPPPENYAALQNTVLNQSGESLLPAAAGLLGEVETWCSF